MNTQERVQLGIDGDCGFALFGGDIQSGECEFVEIDPTNSDQLSAQLNACKIAFKRLRARLGDTSLSYYFGISHPYGG